MTADLKKGKTAHDEIVSLRADVERLKKEVAEYEDPEDAIGLGAALMRAGLHAQARALGVPPEDVVVPMVEKLS